MIGITNPIMWTGVYAVGVPLVIHLMTRRTPVRILFPTLQFLKSAKANQSRMYRIRHIIMLILRTLLVVLILAAFLRPTYEAGALSEGRSAEGRNATVIVLDTSVSMGYSGAGVTPFARGKVAAGRILDDLGSGDVANLILAGSAPQPSFSDDLDKQVIDRARFQLKRDLDRATVGLERAEIDAALAMAVQQLDKLRAASGEGFQREIHFVSDFQRTNWAAVNYAAIPEDVKTVFVSVAEDSAANTAVTEVQLKPPYPSVGEDVEIVCKVANYGNADAEVPLELTFDEQQMATRTLSIAPGMTSSETFRVRPKKDGILEGVLSIPHDTMPSDNVRYFSLSVTERLPVTILTDEPGDDRGAGHRFLRAAINPFPDDSGSLAPTVVAPDAFDAFAASRSHVVLIAGVNPFSEATGKVLVDYLADGGGVIYFLSGDSDKVNLELLARLSEGNLQLPFRAGGLMSLSEDEGDEAASFYEANYDHPMLKPFRDTGALAELRFQQFFATEREEAQGQVLLRYNNGHIALALKSMGLGNLLLANFSLRLEGSDLARHTVFVPLVHQMIRSVRPQSGGAQSFVVGRPCSTTVTLTSPEAPMRFTLPSGTETSAGIDLRDNEGAVIFRATNETGFYRIYSEGDKVGSIAVNIDSRESNLDALTLDQVKELSKVSKEQFFASGGRDMDELRRLRKGIPLWHYLAVAALVILAIEQLAMYLWRR